MDKNLGESIVTGHVSTGKSSFFDLPTEEKKCNNPGHNVPTGICIPKGKGYKHVCPGCGKETIVVPQQVTL